MTPRALRAWYWTHKWSSLICTAFMLLLCVTGLPLVFYHEIDHLLGHAVDPPPMAQGSVRASVDDILARAQALRPGDAIQFLSRDPEEPDAWYVTLGATADAEEASAFYTFDARTGALLNQYPLRQGFMYVFWKLHVDLYAGLAGTLFLGAMGLLLVISLISGAVLYAPFMRKLPFGSVRRERSPRLKWLDLHNLLGIVTLAWLLVVSATGVINTLAIPIFGQWQATELAELTAAYRGQPPLAQIGSVDRALSAAQTAMPGMQLRFMAFPGNPFASPHHFVAFMHGDTPLTSKLLQPVLIDAQTGVVTATRSLPWYVSALLLSQPLHFGDYGGLPLKLLWALLDLLSIVVLGSGLYLWLKRGRAFEAHLAQLHTAHAPAAHEPVS
ncbi:MAG TPA: PepSY domain-containing protein [Nevskiales bacterium]|nr:PepSY domain-containing protein [Nevskiales bacterium]